jgi:hypothetical protein
MDTHVRKIEQTRNSSMDARKKEETRNYSIDVMDTMDATWDDGRDVHAHVRKIEETRNSSMDAMDVRKKEDTRNSSIDVMDTMDAAWDDGRDVRKKKRPEIFNGRARETLSEALALAHQLLKEPTRP